MDAPLLELLSGAGIATGIGLVIGLEREHHETERAGADATKGPAAGGPPLGVRTFALLALSGWTSAVLAGTWPVTPVLAIAVVGALLTAQFVRTTQQDHRLGLTTEVGALLTLLLGMLVHADTRLAVVLALAATVILISRPWVRAVVPRLLRADLTGTLQFLIVLAVVLPLLPEAPVDPWGVLPPRKIGMFVVLVAGIGFVGYVLTRLLGRSRSAWLTGVIGGLVSSTAVTAAMAQQAKADRALVVPGQVAVLLANTVMLGRVLVVTAVISRDVAFALAWPLGAMGFVLLLAVLLSVRALRAARPARARSGSDRREAGGKAGSKAGDEADDEERGPLAVNNPFALLPALKWGALLCVVLVVEHAARTALGTPGLLAAAAVSGLADVDPITLAATRDAAAGVLTAQVAALAIMVAVLTNTALKAGLARLTGGPEFGTRVALALCGAAAVGLGVALLR
jgi:uncharacterized membrane protein (DUF4010 family)